jgi:hypothetical protein
MQQFKDRQDLQEWLDTLDYAAFWKAIDPNSLDPDYKASCDASIAKGVDQNIILKCIKSKKRIEIVKAQNLKPRYYHDPPTLQ